MLEIAVIDDDSIILEKISELIDTCIRKNVYISLTVE